jgi:hypothetical protein
MKRKPERGVILKAWRMRAQGLAITAIARTCKVGIPTVREIFAAGRPDWSDARRPAIEVGDHVGAYGEARKVLAIRDGECQVETPWGRRWVLLSACDWVPDPEEVPGMLAEIREGWSEAELRSRAPYAQSAPVEVTEADSSKVSRKVPAV